MEKKTWKKTFENKKRQKKMRKKIIKTEKNCFEQNHKKYFF
jgi:hypothetical protein